MADEKNKNNKGLLVVSILVLIVCWLEVLFFWKKIPPQIPWFYSLVWGEDQLMNKSGLIWTMGSASILLFTTSFIASWTKKEDLLIEKAVFITLALASILLFLSLTKVLMILAI